MFFLVLANPGSPGQRAVKRLCVCECNQAHKSRSRIRVSKDGNTTGLSSIEGSFSSLMIFSS